MTLNSFQRLGCSLSILFFLTSFLTPLAEASLPRECPSPWRTLNGSSGCAFVPIESNVTYPMSFFARGTVRAKLRAGMVQENPAVPFRGNVLYLQGLGDSMLNHAPLFKRLSHEGFRVIAFDYFGQGGSEGSMNDTRIWDIPRIGNEIYQLFARKDGAWTKPIIVGWSTGGLAAYYAASLKMASKVVLIAPAIVPRLLLGEQKVVQGKLNQITVASLTPDRYDAENIDPHLDPIKPNSPLDAIDFSSNLFEAALASQTWSVPPEIPGLVLLAKNDKYVYSSLIQKTLHIRSPHFSVRSYEGAGHEIDNAPKNIRLKVHGDILEFLSSQK